MGRTKTIMLDIKRGGYARRTATVATTDQWIPGRVAEVNSAGSLIVPTTSTAPKGFVVEGKKSGDGQEHVAIIMDRVVFAAEAYNNNFTNAGTFVSGISLTHGDKIYFDSVGALTNIPASGVGTKVVGHWDADASAVNVEIDVWSTGA